MINGRYDFFFPVESSQDPMFRLLGTPAADKRHVVVEGSHEVPRAISSRKCSAGSTSTSPYRSDSSIARSACRLSMSRKIVATASSVPAQLVAHRAVPRLERPSISTASHFSAWPT